MLKTKISGLSIIIIDGKTGKHVNKIDTSRFGGAKSAIIIITGKTVKAVCKDGRTRYFDIKTGKLKRTI